MVLLVILRFKRSRVTLISIVLLRFLGRALIYVAASRTVTLFKSGAFGNFIALCLLLFINPQIGNYATNTCAKLFTKEILSILFAPKLTIFKAVNTNLSCYPERALKIVLSSLQKDVIFT